VGRLVDPGQLVGAHEIVERLSLKRVQHVHWYREHDPSFPAPIARIGGAGTYVWYWPDVEEWARQAGRLPPGGEKTS
jgi:predicted DNA-binding transcriptional regulator AlpA